MENDSGDRQAPSCSREQALRYPIGVDTHDTGFRFLFDFTVAARALALRPGALVLDFACGSGFVTEWLNRLGYRTVAVDLDGVPIRHAQERLTLDPRCDTSQARFVQADGQHLPFSDCTFDGILCMNALHHMPDYHATLAEMHRVLKPGGRASFSEPGNRHSHSPESVQMARQFGVLEKDIEIQEIHALARKVGFARMMLKPMLYPEMVDLDFEEFEDFSNGRCPPGRRVDAPTIAKIFRAGHALFYLVKAGDVELTSVTAPPSLLRAQLSVSAIQKRGTEIDIKVVCKNTGGSTWVSAARPTGGHVTFGVKIVNLDGRLMDDLKGRQGLPRDVRPNESVEIESRLSLEGLGPRRFRLVFDMVAERVTWFGDLGSPTTEHEIDLSI